MTTRHRPTKNTLHSISSLIALLSTLAISATASAATAPSSQTDLSPTPKSHVLHLNNEAWINDIGTLLYADPDGDGYFSGVSLSIDADTTYHSFEVFAAIDIISSSSDLQSTRRERLHTTRTFDLFGRSFNDEYRVDIDLVRNYSPDTYALEVALFDAHTSQQLDRVSGNEFRNLHNLPLESEENQSVFVPVIERPVEPQNDDIRVVEYAGGTGPGLLIVFILGYLLRSADRIKSRLGLSTTLKIKAKQ